MTSIKIFLDASVILAGIGSFKGSSYALLALGNQKKIGLIVSPIVIDEAKRRVHKVNKTAQDVEALIVWANIDICEIPSREQINTVSHLLADPDDYHLLASCSKITKVSLVTLDRKHLISQRHKIKYPPILLPAEFLEKYIDVLNLK